jgi:hypothetical protein
LHCCLDLFADGDDFSTATLDRNRNRFYQHKLSRQFTDQIDKIVARLTSTLQIHLNVAQSFMVNSPSAMLALHVVADLSALSNQQIHLTNSTRLSFPSRLNVSNANASIHRYTIRVSEMQLD